MKRKYSFIFPLIAVSVFALTSCNLDVEPPIESGGALMTAINYNSNQRIIYSKDASYTTPDEQHTYSKGDFKPFWEYVQNKLGITLKEHAAAANSGEKKSVSYFRDNWLNKPYADITMGTVNAITKYAVSGDKETILDLWPYLEKGDMPHLKKFLSENSGVKSSIMTAKHSHADQAALYFVPYCDGFDDTQRSMMVRQDYITKLLDESPDEFYDKDEKIIGAKGSGAKYELSIEEPYIKDKTYTIKLPNVDISTGIIIDKDNPNVEFTKKELDQDHPSIIEQQNKLIKEGKATSKDLAKQFQDYIYWRYFKGYESKEIFTRNSDLFLGWKACFDTDELIALMRLVKVSAKTLYGEGDTKEMVTWFPTEWTNVCSADLYRWAGQVFGVRGTDSRTGYLYFNGLNTFKEGFEATEKIHDCRGDAEMLNLIKTLQKLYKEGLLMQDFDSQTATGTTNNKFNEQLILDYKEEKDKPNKKYHGFMSYYTPFSESKLNDFNDIYKKSSDKRTEDGTVYGPIIGAVTKWDTNGDGTLDNKDPYMQFTESWISAKTSALCLNADLANNDVKREAAFKLIDYVFSPEGQANYNYGPMEYGYYYDGTFNTEGNFELSEKGIKQKQEEVSKGLITEERPGVITYQGKTYPQYTFKAEEEIKTVDGVVRERVGVTMPFGFVKMNGVVFQQTRETAREGVLKINKAVECGTYKHTCINDVLEEYKNLDKSFVEDLKTNKEKQPFYKIVPASFYLTDGQNTDIARILDKTKLGSMYTDDNQSQFNIWDDYVMGSKSSFAPELDKYLETVNGSWECPKLVTYYQQAYELMA